MIEKKCVSKAKHNWKNIFDQKQLNENIEIGLSNYSTVSDMLCGSGKLFLTNIQTYTTLNVFAVHYCSKKNLDIKPMIQGKILRKPFFRLGNRTGHKVTLQ